MMQITPDLDRGLIGQSKGVLDTPALLVDLDTMENNIARVIAECRRNGIAWRPHCKGHRSVDIARKQVAAGAIGVTCAKLGEAELMAAAEIRSILIANQIVGRAKIVRLMTLLSEADVVVCVDSIPNIDELNAAALEAGGVQKVAVEVNVGMNRAGVEPGAATVALVDEIAKRPGLKFVGLLTWESHATRIADSAEKSRVVESALAKLVATARACVEAGHAVEIVSCGGTGTFPFCARQPGVTEIVTGGAIFSDRHYITNYHTDFTPALTVLATVTSRPTPTRIITDAGRKAMSCDTATPLPLGLPEIRELKFSAEHSKIELAAPSEAPCVGDKIELMVGYSDSTVYLHEDIIALRNGRIEAIWPTGPRRSNK